jgi:hypothetical protein
VTSTTPALVAEYRYNGLGFRMLARRHHDQRPPPRPPTVGPDRTVNGDDPWYFFCYDERWRIVATFRGSDADPKEAFVRHAAGLDGRGGCFYEDLGAVGLVGLRAPVSPQVPGLGVGAAGGCGGLGRDGGRGVGAGSIAGAIGSIVERAGHRSLARSAPF